MPIRLMIYIARNFSIWLIVFSGLICVLILIGDTLELLRRFGDDGVGFLYIMQLAFLKLLTMMDKVTPFIIFAASLTTLTKLSRSRELVVARALGVSIWKLLLPLLVIACIAGIGRVLVLNPMAAATWERYYDLEQSGTGKVHIDKQGVWLRQKDSGGYSIIRAKSLLDATTIKDVTILRFDNNGYVQSRAFSKLGILQDGYWILQDAVLAKPLDKPVISEMYQLKTDLSPDDIINAEIDPVTLPFFALNRYIQQLQAAGFNNRAYKQHMYNLLASPALYVMMVILAALFLPKKTQRGRITLLIINSLIAGFLLYFLNNLITALGLSGALSPLLAAFCLPVFIILLGISALLHVEDG